MGNVIITMNGRNLSVPEDSTILEAAEANSIRIPTLCTLKRLDPRASCRLCVVEVLGSRTFQPACATKVSTGMVVETDTPALRMSRKTSLALLLSNHAVDCHHCLRIGSSRCDDLDPKFCEMCFFCDCVRDGFCELQALAREYKVDALPYEMEPYKYKLDDSTGSIIRDPNKCVKCRHCLDVCGSVQTVHALSLANRASRLQVIPAMNKPLAESPCVRCGRCIEVCPTGALFAQEHKDELLYYTHNYDINTLVQLSANVLSELALLYKSDLSQVTLESVAAGLRKIGVDYVFADTYSNTKVNDSAADVLSKRLADGETSILLTNSFAAKRFVRQYFSDLEPWLLKYESPQHWFDSYAKTVFAKEKQLDTRQIKTIFITNDNENAAEAVEAGGADLVLNARELYRIFLRSGVNLKLLPPSELDNFGSNGDMESKFETLFAPITWEIGSDREVLEFAVNRAHISAAITRNLGQVRSLLEQVRMGTSPYRVIRLNT